MADENVVAVQVTADVGSYVDAMKQAASVTGTSSENIKASLAAASAQARDSLVRFVDAAKEAGTAAKGLGEDVGRLPAPAGEAERSMGGLTGIIKDYRQEVRTEGRYSRFLAGDIASMGLASKSAAGEVTMLVSAFAFGGGVGVAIEAVKMLVRSITESGEEAHRQADEIKKLYGETAKSITEAMNTIRHSFEAATESKTQQEWSRQIDLSRDKMRELDDKIAAVVAKKGGFADLADVAAKFAKSIAGDGEVIESNLDRQIRDLQEQKDAILRGIEAAHPSKDRAQGAEKKADDDARAAIEQQVDQKILELRAQALDGNEKLEAEYVAKIAAIDENEKLTAEQRGALKTAQLEVYRKQLTDFAANEAQKEVERQKAADAEIIQGGEEILKEYNKQQAEKRKQAQETQRLIDGMQAIEDAAAKKATDEAKRQAKEQLHTVQEMATGVGSAFAGIVSGTESVGKAFADMASAAIKALIDLAIKSVEASAVKAGGEAAASQAGIPIFGPALAIAAMAATEAAVLGLLSSLPSAAGGWGEVPHDLTANIHKGEQVWPAQYAEGGRQLLTMLADGSFSGGGSAQQVFADDGGGGDEIHVHFHVPAGAFLDQTTANRFIADPMVQKAISNAVRLGRWGNV